MRQEIQKSIKSSTLAIKIWNIYLIRFATLDIVGRRLTQVVIRWRTFIIVCNNLFYSLGSGRPFSQLHTHSSDYQILEPLAIKMLLLKITSWRYPPPGAILAFSITISGEPNLLISIKMFSFLSNYKCFFYQPYSLFSVAFKVKFFKFKRFCKFINQLPTHPWFLAPTLAILWHICFSYTCSCINAGNPSLLSGSRHFSGQGIYTYKWEKLGLDRRHPSLRNVCNVSFSPFDEFSWTQNVKPLDKSCKTVPTKHSFVFSCAFVLVNWFSFYPAVYIHFVLPSTPYLKKKKSSGTQHNLLAITK